jgi:hypothetical protein
VGVIGAVALYVLLPLAALPAGDRLASNNGSTPVSAFLAIWIGSLVIACVLRLVLTVAIRRSGHRLVERVLFSAWTPGIALGLVFLGHVGQVAGSS